MKRRLVIRFNAPVILSFALLSLLALVLGTLTNDATTYRFFSVYRSSLSDPLTYVRFFGHVLGHAGYEHYMGNMLLLLLVGPGIEEKYGHKTTALCIAITALVFMMIVLSSFTEMGKEGIPITLILVVIFYLGGELIDSLTAADNVSRLTHIVGGLCGLVFGFSIKRRRHR